MKKIIMGSLISCITLMSPAIAQQQSNEVSVKNIKQNQEDQYVSKDALKRIDTLIKKTSRELTKVENSLKPFKDKNKRLKMTEDQKVNLLNKASDDIKVQDSHIDDIFFIAEYLPKKMVEANFNNAEKSNNITKDLLVIVLQTMADTLDTKLEFKIGGERNQTLIVSSDKPRALDMSDFSEDLKLSMLHLGLEDILFTDFKKDIRLVKIQSKLQEN